MAIHIYPLDDLKEHVLESTCECQPTVSLENGELIVCHNAFDGRELVEEVNEILKTTKPY